MILQSGHTFIYESLSNALHLKGGSQKYVKIVVLCSLNSVYMGNLKKSV